MRAMLMTGLVATLLSLPAAWAQDSQRPVHQVIVHASNPVLTMPRAKVANFFLKKLSTWDNGTPVRPFDLPDASPVRKAFTEQVLKKTMGAVASYWQQQIFSGRGVAPPQKPSDAAVMAAVAGDPGGIGYVSAGAALIGVKELVLVE